MNLPIPALILAAVLFAGSSSSDQQDPDPNPNPNPNPDPDPNPNNLDEPDDVVLCDIDLGGYLLDGGETAGEIASTYYQLPAQQWAASTTPGGGLREWAVNGAISAVKLLGGKEESTWPLCWGGGSGPPAGWSFLDWAAVLAVRQTLTTVASGAAPFAIPPITGSPATGIASALLNYTPAQLRSLRADIYNVPKQASYVVEKPNALAYTLFNGARRFYEATLLDA